MRSCGKRVLVTLLGMGVEVPPEPGLVCNGAGGDFGLASLLFLKPVRASSPHRVPTCSPWTMEALSPPGCSEHQVFSASWRSTGQDSSSLPLFQDLDDMDADLLGLKRSNLATSKRAAKRPGKEELPGHPKPAGVLTASEKGEWETA